MILHHALEVDHEVRACLRHTKPFSPWLSTVREIRFEPREITYVDPRTGKTFVLSDSGGMTPVVGQITPQEAGDWILTDATPRERTKLHRLGFRFASGPAGPDGRDGSRDGAAAGSPGEEVHRP